MTLSVDTSTANELLADLSGLIVRGASLDQTLEYIFESFAELIPFDRIGFADIENERGIAIARWSKSDERTLLRNGYSAPLAHSSLSVVIAQRMPRVLNNLPEYLAHRPKSRSTALIVREGIRSSMTCPLFIDDTPVGMLFFSSRELDTYDDSHVHLLKNIAGQLATLLMTSNDLASAMAKPRRRGSSNRTRPDWKKDIDFTLGQLRPGMVLASAIRLTTGAVLLAEGTELSQLSIDRLIKLNEDDVMHIDSVLIR